MARPKRQGQAKTKPRVPTPEERAERRARRLRRLGWGTAAMVTLGGLGWCGVWLANPAHLPVRTVRLENRPVHVSVAAIRRTVAPYVKAGFLRLNVAAVRNALEALPWVYRASVRRAWPDALVMNITEQTPIARWAAGGVVNAQGERFVPAKVTGEQGLPLLKGPEGTEAMVAARYLDMQRMLTPFKLKVAEVDVNARRAWRAELSDGIALRFGRLDYETRLMRFVRAYPQVLAPRVDHIATVDLRYTNGFAVRWRKPDAAGA